MENSFLNLNLRLKKKTKKEIQKISSKKPKLADEIKDHLSKGAQLHEKHPGFVEKFIDLDLRYNMFKNVTKKKPPSLLKKEERELSELLRNHSKDDKIIRLKELRNDVFGVKRSPEKLKKLDHAKKLVYKENTERIKKRDDERENVLKRLIEKSETNYASIDMVEKINLETLAHSLDNAEYDPNLEGNNILTWKMNMHGKRITLRVYGSGKVKAFGSSATLIYYAEAFRQLKEKLKEIHAEEVVQNR